MIIFLLIFFDEDFSVGTCEDFDILEIVVDENCNETGEIKKGYTKGLVTVLANYNFNENPREIYAAKDDENESILC